MRTENTTVWSAVRVNTKIAYRAWGIDIDDLEFRRKNSKNSEESIYA